MSKPVFNYLQPHYYEDRAILIELLEMRFGLTPALFESNVCILAIANGGLILANDLRRRFNCDMEIIAIKSYNDANEKHDIECKYAPNLNIFDKKHIIVVDDIIDSGKTLLFVLDYLNDKRHHYDGDHSIEFLSITAVTLVSKIDVKFGLDSGIITPYYARVIEDQWIHFFWEESAKYCPTSQPISYHIEKILQSIEGESFEREGLKDTPFRVEKMYKELFSGYSKQPNTILKRTFKADYDEMIIEKDIDFYSHCEHHMVPFFGKVHIGYIPNGEVVGLSKLARLVQMYAHRLQIQERLTEQIHSAIVENLKPKGCIVVIEAQHLCMCMRGVKSINAKTTTSALSGVFKDVKTRDSARAEFMRLIS
jgi:GTP cyclohydrolase I